ncbi:GNAT family N-acetyltransferase [Nocardioides mangrovi]|uniref:GNAT family N-acetyltransferase n=1 Tax=Nocardioides mangrovi TaxID=2874580 RepID=A0ABS7U7C3_9ACTN|nr:GNAT family N-acetyltransferase [Nocardioides mangrovi]MBZ5736868.1 GNAT family N-acetyltransferase [Nocardioides mangrovi]
MTRSQVSLRAATADDATRLAEVWGDVIRRVDAEERVADMTAVLAAVAESTDQRIVVAEYDGQFAGAVHLQATTMSALNLEPVVRALSPHVLPEFRRHGVGSALMDAAVQWAEELGIGHVATAAVAGSRDANRFMARIALGPYAVLRVATTHAVRARLTAHRRPAIASGGRQLTQVLAARRSMRRSRAAAEG